MAQFEEKKFNIPKLKGISEENIKEHLKLYSGYVKFTNTILSDIEKLSAEDPEKHLYVITEMQRRLSFEFNGMRNHEYYFASLEGNSTPLTINGPLAKNIKKEWTSFDNWLAKFKMTAKTRGVGWAMLYYDKKTGQLINSWVDEQHIGQLNGLSPILALDMWEHAFVADYEPSGKGRYIDDFFANLNWSVIEKNFADAV